MLQLAYSLYLTLLHRTLENGKKQYAVLSTQRVLMKLRDRVECPLLTKLGRMQPRNYHNTFVRNLAESGHRIFSYDILQLAPSRPATPRNYLILAASVWAVCRP